MLPPTQSRDALTEIERDLCAGVNELSDLYARIRKDFDRWQVSAGDQSNPGEDESVAYVILFARAAVYVEQLRTAMHELHGIAHMLHHMGFVQSYPQLADAAYRERLVNVLKAVSIDAPKEPK